MRRLRRQGPLVHNRYELIACAFGGHVLAGTDAAEVTEADALIVRQVGVVRWYRCLRCDGWFAMAPPATPTRPRLPGRDEIAVPLRGTLLRDRYVLRLIALDRAVHVLLLTLLAVVIFVFAGNHAALQRDYDQILQAFGGPSQSHPFLGRFRQYFTITTRHLDEAGVAVTFYAVLEGVEMVGLWLAKRWAEYLTFVATTLLIPLEVYELVEGLSALKLITFVINLVIVLYLLWAKRLFGLHGGRAAEEQRRLTGTGWAAIEHNDPPSFEPVAP
jgi:uncharacterized membrane protein (DUF2068 family)